MHKTIVFGSLILTLTACARGVDDGASVSICDDVAPKKITVNGANLNGYTLNGTELGQITVDGKPSVGQSARASLADGTAVALLIAAESEGLFELTHEGKNVCAGDGKGVFVKGIWDERGARHDSTLSTFACTTGAIAKCVSMGYDPARVGAAMHQACTRMLRADYCGDGVSSTRDGMLVDVFDTRGINVSTDDAALSFEAAWNENGATCVNRARIASATPSCFRDLPTCTSQDDAIARGATLMNASRVTCQ